MLLQRADTEAAGHKAEALSAAIAKAPVTEPGGAAFNISATYGVREIGGADSAEQALAEADVAMYMRKPSRT